MLTRNQAKARIKDLGWSYRRVAPLLDVGHVHLAQVMRGDRDSRRLMLAIAELPPCPKHLIPHNSPRRRPA
jgi:hypothetical protein